MKKIISLAFGVMLSMAAVSKAELPDFIEATILDHVSAVTLIGGDEDYDGALMDSLIQIGKYNGSSIVDLQVGYSVELNTDSGSTQDGDFIIGALLRLDPILKDKVNFPEHYQFLQSIVHGPSIHYNCGTYEWNATYQVGLAFSLDPKTE